MKKVFTLMAVAMAALVSASCDKNKETPVPVEEEKIVEVTNYVIVYGAEDNFKFYDITLNYKCGSVSESIPLKIEDMTYEHHTNGESETDVIIGLGSCGEEGKYKVIPVEADWSKPYDLSISVDIKVKNIADFPAPGDYAIKSNITGLFVKGVTNTGFSGTWADGKGTVWYPTNSVNTRYITLEDNEQSKESIHKELETRKELIAAKSNHAVKIAVNGKTLDVTTAN